jgi:hypothetical protein
VDVAPSERPIHPHMPMRAHPKVERLVPEIRSVFVYGVECSVSLGRSRSLSGLASAAQCEEIATACSGCCDRRSCRCQVG